MNYYIFKTLRLLLGKIGIETDALGRGVAASPFGLHLLHKKPLNLHADHWLPLGDQWWHGLPNLLSIPCLDDHLFPVAKGRWTQSQKHSAVFQFYRRGGVELDHLEEIAFPPDEVALTIQILARRLALLPAEFLLLLLDPAQFGNRKDANCIEGHTRGGRNANLASRGIDA